MAFQWPAPARHIDKPQQRNNAATGQHTILRLDLGAGHEIQPENDDVGHNVHQPDVVEDGRILERNTFRHLHHAEDDDEIGSAQREKNSSSATALQTECVLSRCEWWRCSAGGADECPTWTPADVPLSGSGIQVKCGEGPYICGFMMADYTEQKRGIDGDGGCRGVDGGRGVRGEGDGEKAGRKGSWRWGG